MPNGGSGNDDDDDGADGGGGGAEGTESAGAVDGGHRVKGRHREGGQVEGEAEGGQQDQMEGYMVGGIGGQVACFSSYSPPPPPSYLPSSIPSSSPFSFS